MRKGHFAVICFLAFTGGIVGGLISNWIFQLDYATAKTKKISDVIEAKEFRVVDDDGKIMGYFGSKGNLCVLSIEDKTKDDLTSIELSYLGLKATHETPNYWKYAKAQTSITFWGFEYVEYSKYEYQKMQKQPLQGLFDRRYNISIGENHGKAAGPCIQLYDSGYRLRAALGTIENIQAKTDSIIQRPTSSLVLYNESGNVIWEAP